VSASEAIGSRSDLEALRYQQKASESNVKVVKGDYYPSIAFSAGYVALDIQNVAQVYNAVNFGVGFSYDIANVFKNSKKVKAAQSRAEETRQELEIRTDQVKVQVQEAQENYNLSIKQDKVYTEAVEQATENYRIVKDKYENGLNDTNDLLEADVEQLQAKINEAFSKADITQRYYELLNASGKLTNSFNLTPNKN
jgi:outer membrane protein